MCNRCNESSKLLDLCRDLLPCILFHRHLLIKLTPAQDQNQTLQQLSELVPDLRAMLDGEIRAVNDACLEAKIEENDYTVLTYDDLQFELELAEAGIRKKIAFVENQVGSSSARIDQISFISDGIGYSYESDASQARGVRGNIQAFRQRGGQCDLCLCRIGHR